MKKIILLVLIGAFLGACGSSATLVMEPVKKSFRVSGVKVIATDNNVAVPQEASKYLYSKIKEGLYEKGGFNESNELVLEYKFLQHDKGNQFARWFTGGIGNAGEASLTVLAVYKDSKGNQLSTTQVNGKIGSGFFGGSFNSVMDQVADEIVDFTKVNFGKN